MAPSMFHRVQAVECRIREVGSPQGFEGSYWNYLALILEFPCSPQDVPDVELLFWVMRVWVLFPFFARVIPNPLVWGLRASPNVELRSFAFMVLSCLG